ncbi:hypothetical protein GN316_05065 [Xylophilus sp. Kf1]|nr:hypothetical protein [Xylophilus sp. Kf1]
MIVDMKPPAIMFCTKANFLVDRDDIVTVNDRAVYAGARAGNRSLHQDAVFQHRPLIHGHWVPDQRVVKCCAIDMAPSRMTRALDGGVLDLNRVVASSVIGWIG